MTTKISSRKVLAQIKYDLIGKDSYRGVSLTYSWLANQFGHFSLAFVTTFGLYHLLQHLTCILNPAFWAGIGITAAWFLFECYNFLGPLLLKKSKQASKNKSGGYTFQPDWKNIAFDTATDVLFFAIGAFTMSNSLEHNSFILYILLGLIAAVIYPVCHWYLTKMYQQAACYPFQFRLSQWNKTITDVQKSTIIDFVNTTETGKHLLLFGTNNSGKTSLSVAIANEQSIKHKSCSYTTAMKLFSQFYEPNIDITDSNSLDLWVWRNAGLLIVDDVNPGLNIDSNLISATLFYSFLTNDTFGNDNKKALQNNVIWVLGNNTPTDNKEQEWIDMLTQIGIEKTNIICLNL